MISAMISVVIPTLNAQMDLTRTLASLVSAAIDGFVTEVIVADGGSSDATVKIADDAGADIVHCEKGRGVQLAIGAKAAKGRWLLFLHADTVLQPGWEMEAHRHIRDIEIGDKPDMAAAFRFVLDDHGKRAAYLQWMVGLRCRILKLPYGDQGLLISRRLYDEIGGFKPVSLMEDVDLVRRLGRRRITMFRTAAVTSAERYRQEGYGRRMIRNLACLGLYYLWIPHQMLARLYG